MNEPTPSSSLRQPRRFVVLLVIALLAVFVYMIADLLLAVVVGALLWAMTEGIYNSLLRRLRGKRGAAASLSLATTILLFIVPLGLLLVLMASNAATLAQTAQAWFEPYRPQVAAKLEQISSGRSVDVFGYVITTDDVVQRIESASGKIGQLLLTIVQKTLGGLARTLLLLGVTLYTLFFFYLDGPSFIGGLKRLLPLEEAQSARLIGDFFATSRAALKTVAVIGAAQGLLGGLAFWVCGIPAPFFWGVLMAIASIIPAVGCHVITVPAAVLLMLMGHTWYGLGLLIWSAVVISSVDNLLRPVLVKRDVNLHPLLVFLSTIGGIATFGFFGVLLGPVIAALLKVSLQMYEQVYRT
jgi:predicted PurR-regulated permease PerM